MRSAGPLALARLADDELRVPAVMALKKNIEMEGERLIGW